MKEIPLSNLLLNPMAEISDGWMLITAGSEGRYNTMTACWGQLGAVWGHGRGLPAATVYVRPQRYTRQFLDREPLFTLSFFPKGYKKALAYLGSHSGRDGDKVAAAGLTPVFGDGWTGFVEAGRILVCRKLYHAALLESGFTDRRILEDNYPQRDFHEMYIGEIVRILEKEEA